MEPASTFTDQETQEELPQSITRSRNLVDFWDDFYVQNGSNEGKIASTTTESTSDDHTNKTIPGSIEWIIYPNKSLFDQLYPFLHPVSTQEFEGTKNNQRLNILEIGSGTSTFARDFGLYLLKRRDQTTDATHQPARSPSTEMYVTATDVSDRAVQFNRRRDFPQYTSLIGYQVWNVVSEHPSHAFLPSDGQHPCRFPVILDKGCLDTILFRSEKRNLATAMANFLNHVFEAMSDGNGCADGEAAVYLIITPRRKNRWVQSFQGFASVERHKLLADASSGKAAAIYKAEKNSQAYLYVCRKHGAWCRYRPGIDTAFLSATETSAEDRFASLSTCPSCAIDRCDFRCNGKDHMREWVGHCTHCKANAT